MMSASPETDFSTEADWSTQLSAFEKGNLERYRALWAEAGGSPENGVYLLNQDPDERTAWTRGKDGSLRVPTLPPIEQVCEVYMV